MKRFLGPVLGLLLASVALAAAPERRNEVFVGVGDAGLLFMVADVGTVVFSLGTVTYGDEELGFAVAAGYQRWFTSWSSVGVTAGWAGSRKPEYFQGQQLGDVERRLLSVMADLRGHWLRRPAWDFYSGLAAGVGQLRTDLISTPDEDELCPAFQVTLLGVRGGREWGAFGEMGVGLTGFVKGGLSRRW